MSSASDSDFDLGQTLRGFVPGQRVFKRYTLTRMLGRGGMGVVWLAKDEELEREVALKFLPETVALDGEAVSDLKRETRRSLELTHSNIVRIYDFLADGSLAAISMEYVAGETLAARKLKAPAKRFDVAELDAWVRQICEALAHAHAEAKVVHRDLKPANVMITPGGRVKILDFGIAASISESASRVSNRGTSGTLSYMSPQQLLGKAPTAADDIYALGATLYELLTGKPPFFRGDVATQVLNAPVPTIAERRAELAAGPEDSARAVPAAWEETIAACLAKEPGERPATATGVLARLRGETSPTDGAAGASGRRGKEAVAQISQPRDRDIDTPFFIRFAIWATLLTVSAAFVASSPWALLGCLGGMLGCIRLDFELSRNSEKSYWKAVLSGALTWMAVGNSLIIISLTDWLLWGYDEPLRITLLVLGVILFNALVCLMYAVLRRLFPSYIKLKAFYYCLFTAFLGGIFLLVAVHLYGHDGYGLEGAVKTVWPLYLVASLFLIFGSSRTKIGAGRGAVLVGLTVAVAVPTLLFLAIEDGSQELIMLRLSCGFLAALAIASLVVFFRTSVDHMRVRTAKVAK